MATLGLSIDNSDRKRHKAEKERIAGDVIAGLEERFPGITAQVEMKDLATPISWERYTGNWRDAYMAGQWVNPGGGMPTALMSGDHTVQLIRRKDRKRFVTSTP